jgi:TolB-like protein
MIRCAVLLLLTLFSSVVSVDAEETAAAIDSSRVVVLPFANYTGRYEALEKVLPVFYDKVRAEGLSVMSHEDLRPLLREHRLRVVGEMGVRAMDLIREETQAGLAIVGSIDIYEPDRAFEVMISARLVDLQDHVVLTAISVGRTVQETERVFGRGRAEEIEDVIGPVVTEFLERLVPLIRGERAPFSAYHKCGLVAIVPMEDYSGRRHGAEVLQNLLMTELVARAWPVVEPGVVSEVLLDEQRLARGGASNEILRVLRDRLSVCYVVTGEVEEFKLAPSGVENAVPRIDFGLRLIDARAERLVASIDLARDGMEGEFLFGRGREYSIVRLARESISDVVTWIEKEGD